MKILKYILFIVIGLVLLFFLVGVIKPTVSYGHEVKVNKSAEEAWAVMLDESNYAQWLEGFKSIELIEGEQGAVGSKYKVIVNPSPDQPDFEMIETVMSFKEYEEVVLHFDSDMMEFEQTTSFSQKDGMTTVKTDSEVKGKGLMMRSMFSIMEMLTGSFTTQEVKNIEALKVLIDKNTVDYFPSAPVLEVEGLDSNQ